MEAKSPENPNDAAAPVGTGNAESANDARVEANPAEVTAATLHLPGLIQESFAEPAVQEVAVSGQGDGLAAAGESQARVAPEQATPDIPEAFNQLKAYCDEHHLKCTIDPELQLVNLEFRNGRDTRTVAIFSEENAEALLHYPLDEVVFLGGYSAVCSYKEAWIEAAVRAHGVAPRSFIARRSLFGTTATRSQQQGEVEIRETPDVGGLTLRLTETPGVLSALEMDMPLYLRIEGIGITEHDKALNLLEDLSNSLFMQIDFRFDSPLSLVRSRQPRRGARSRGRLDQDNQLTYPRHSYERTPSSLYWYARSATSMPLLQFLAFYQCIEFFFPQFSRQETIAKIKNVLKDPAFNWTNDSDINTILNVTLEGRRGSLLDERKQLRATLEHCVDGRALHDFLNQTEERTRYFGSDYKKISEKRISLSKEDDVVEQTAERMYDIRCKVVHTKNLEGGEGEEMIIPFSKEADLMIDDVELIKFLARKVLIASSIPIKP